jgi:hypothetical protein
MGFGAFDSTTDVASGSIAGKGPSGAYNDKSGDANSTSRGSAGPGTYDNSVGANENHGFATFDNDNGVGGSSGTPAGHGSSVPGNDGDGDDAYGDKSGVAAPVGSGR